MTKDDIIKLAREAGLQFSESLVKDFSAAVESTYQDLIKQAVAAEREACAKVCEERGMVKGGEVFSARIRARGTT